MCLAGKNTKKRTRFSWHFYLMGGYSRSGLMILIQESCLSYTTCAKIKCWSETVGIDRLQDGDNEVQGKRGSCNSRGVAGNLLVLETSIQILKPVKMLFPSRRDTAFASVSNRWMMFSASVFVVSAMHSLSEVSVEEDTVSLTKSDFQCLCRIEQWNVCFSPI